MNKEKILLTGITGFIGGRLAQYLLDKGHKIIAPVRKRTYIYNPNKNLVICSYDELFKKVNNEEIDYFYHCASLTSVNCEDQNLIYKTNIELANLVARISSICRPKIIFFTSTISIYGEINNSILSFNQKINTNKLDSYGRSKLIAEKIIEEYCIRNNCRYVLFRLPGIVGYGSHSNLLSKVINTLLSDNDKVLNLFNAENLFNNMLDIYTLISYLEKLKFNDKNNPQIIKTILACKNPIKIGQVISLIQENLKVRNQKRIKWNTNDSKSFILDHKYQTKFDLMPISTISSINKLCKDIIDGNNFPQKT